MVPESSQIHQPPIPLHGGDVQGHGCHLLLVYFDEVVGLVTPVYCILFTVILILESEFEADVVWELQLIPTGQSPAGPALAKQM